MVAAGRHMDAAQVRQLADGRAYTGRQAKQLGLVDEIGGEPEAREWLAKQKHVPASLPVRDLTTSGWADRAIGSAFGGFMKILWQQGLTLDGIWAIWQPAASGT
jgi:protease-4